MRKRYDTLAAKPGDTLAAKPGDTTRPAKPRDTTRRRSLAVALGVVLASVSGLRLHCARNTAENMPLATYCAWLPCAGRNCDSSAAGSQAGGAPASSVPVSGVPVSGAPISGVPAARMPTSGVPAPGLSASGVPASGLPGPAAPASSSSLAAAILLQNPASAPHWLRLSRLLWMEQQPEKAALCLEQTVALAPNSPPVLLEAAALSHASGGGARGFELMSRVLAATRDYDGVIFAFYGRAADVAAVLRQGLPRDPAAARAYLLHLIEARDTDGARLAWAWLLRFQFADRAILRRYLRYLIEDGLPEQAANAFTNFLPPEERPTGGNRVTHGGFEAASTGAPLDWTVTPSPHAQARRDDSSAREGRWSLRIEFDGAENVAYRHVAQQAVVKPGRWKLQAWIRADRVTSGQGVGLRIFEARSAPAWQVWTETVSGNSDWKRIEAIVTVPPAVRLVRIEIVRRPSNKLDNRIGGVVWIDGVSLTPYDDST